MPIFLAAPLALSACASTPDQAAFTSDAERVYHVTQTEAEGSQRAVRDAQRDVTRVERQQREYERDIRRAEQRLQRLQRRDTDARRELAEAEAAYAARVEAAERARLLVEAEQLEAQAAAARQEARTH